MDITPIQDFFDLSYNQMMFKFLINVGWMPIAAVLVWGAVVMWVYYRNLKYAESLSYILLAIDIPKGNEQSPKAIENLFTYIAGAHSTFNLLEIYWEGRYQLGFSFEIVSIDGYTQFLIWTEARFRNLVESAVYSQYPDAEINEINDYAENLPSTFPDDEWDIWGGEFIYKNNQAYPIKTYDKFYDLNEKTKETTFKDPMASLIDLCGSLQKGEQLWYQIIVYPTGLDWTEEINKEAKKILKEKTGSSGGVVETFFAEIWSLFAEFFYQLTSEDMGAASAENGTDDPLKMMQLKPQEKKQVEAIQNKAGQLGFEVKNRFIYVAKKELMNKPKVAYGFVGYMKQFMDLDLNNLKPDMDMTITGADYFFVDSRINAKKNRIMAAYKGRSGTRGRVRKIMTIDELATLWHFPIETVVKAPLVQKTPGRKSEPPMSLPVEDETVGETFFDSEDVTGTPAPTHLPSARPATRLASPGIGGQALQSGGQAREGNEEGKDLKQDETNSLPWDEPGEDIPAKNEVEKTKPKKSGAPPENLPFA